MNYDDKLTSSLPPSLDELLKKLQEVNVEDFANKLVSEYINKLNSK